MKNKIKKTIFKAALLPPSVHEKNIIFHCNKFHVQSFIERFSLIYLAHKTSIFLQVYQKINILAGDTN